MAGIIADFERPFRRDARAMGLNLLDDTDFWTFLKTRFEQGIIAKGIEPMDLPTTLELGDGEFLPRIAHGQVVRPMPRLRRLDACAKDRCCTTTFATPVGGTVKHQYCGL